jgi:demethylmenaquinone methyltransferase/2-methoxy-6-polyprenyl-1,4-benzoquinol methylase
MIYKKDPAVIREMFAQIVPRYDFLNHLLSFNMDRRWRSYAGYRILEETPHRILDLCTGTGDLAFWCRRKAVNGTRIVGVDFCIPMLQQARRKGKGVSFLAGDALALPFRNGAFDVVTASFGVRNFSSLEGGFREIGRVLKRGGKLIVTEFTGDTHPYLGWAHRCYIGRVLPGIGRLFTGGDAYRYLADSISTFDTRARLVELMEQTGFRPVERRPQTMGVVTHFIGTKR